MLKSYYLHLKKLYPLYHYKQFRQISVLYVTGNKATENYAPIRPYMNFEETFRNIELLNKSINQRKLEINVSELLAKYENYLEIRNRLQKLEEQREGVAKNIKELAKVKGTESKINSLKEQGKQYKDELKKHKDQFYEIEDEFIHEFLSLPNTLHQNCPHDQNEKIIYRNTVPTAEKSESHLKRKDLIRFIDNSYYYLLEEAAEFDVNCTFALTSYFVHSNDFIQTANPDFVRRVLLEANTTPIEEYHQVIEEKLENKINVAYLTGGGSFESYLGYVAKLCVYPSVLPLRFACSGRTYNKYLGSSDAEANLFTATQSNAVQVFTASLTASEADQQMEDILNLAINFYKNLDIPFRIVYVNASKLRPAESLRAEIEMYSPAQERYICVGHVSNYGNYVSKRILFVSRENKEYNFLHLVGGPILYTTRLIAALIENKKSLSNIKLLNSDNKSEPSTKMEEFKNLFK